VCNDNYCHYMRYPMQLARCGEHQILVHSGRAHADAIRNLP
jgi:hypothetical protein